MNNMTATAAWTGPPSGPSREPHIPVRSFNSVELKDALRKGMGILCVGFDFETEPGLC